MQKIVFILFSVLLSFNLTGQTKGEIRAAVTDKENGDSIAYCTAYILKPDSLKKTGVNSDEKGLCHFKLLDAGFYTLVFSYPGYKTDTISGIVVSANKTTYLHVKLSPLTYRDPDFIVEPGRKKIFRKKKTKERSSQFTRGYYLRMGRMQKFPAIGNKLSVHKNQRAGNG